MSALSRVSLRHDRLGLCREVAQTQDVLQPLGIPGGQFPLALLADLLGGCVLVHQVQRHAPKSREVLGAMADADATVVLAEDHIERSVLAVLGRPVLANRLVELLSAKFVAADVVGPAKRPEPA